MTSKFLGADNRSRAAQKAANTRAAKAADRRARRLVELFLAHPEATDAEVVAMYEAEVGS